MRQRIKAESLRQGFSHCGIAKAEPLEDLRRFYTAYLQKGAHEPFTYLKTQSEKRLNPALLLPGVKSLVALLMNYNPPQLPERAENYIISRYACGKDYHPLMKERLSNLANFIKDQSAGAATRIFVDSGPVLEKAWAQRSGLGWQGKNSLIINKSAGSYFFIGILLTTLELEPDLPETGHCGTCDLCIRACPTGALHTPYQLEIKQCIAYHTIENKGEIPAAIREKMQNRIYGCDICQEACPYNRFAQPATEPWFFPGEEMQSMRKKDWDSLTREGFDRLFDQLAVKRTGFEKFKSNLTPPSETY